MRGKTKREIRRALLYFHRQKNYFRKLFGRSLSHAEIHINKTDKWILLQCCIWYFNTFKVIPLRYPVRNNPERDNVVNEIITLAFSPNTALSLTGEVEEE